MQELVLNGKTYVKAVDIAKHLGYTSDYVGQLCRSGKVDAEQVGRAWYVVPDTIQSHKQTRYRSNQAKSKSAVAAYKAAQRPRSSVSRSVNTTHHLRVNHYEADETDLIPSLKKTTPPTVPAYVPADTQTTAAAEPVPVPVTTTEPPHTFSNERPEPVRFNGNVALKIADTEELRPEKSVPAAVPVTVVHETTTHTPATRTDDTEAEQSQTRRRSQSVTVADDQGASPAALPISVRSKRSRSQRNVGSYLTLVTLWLFLIGALSFAFLGSEVVWTVTNSSQIASIQFDIENVYENINKYIDISSKR